MDRTMEEEVREIWGVKGTGGILVGFGKGRSQETKNMQAASANWRSNNNRNGFSLRSCSKNLAQTMP